MCLIYTYEVLVYKINIFLPVHSDYYYVSAGERESNINQMVVVRQGV